MSEGEIFLVNHQDDNPIPMSETEYLAEDILQALLMHYPHLQPGDQINPKRRGAFFRDTGDGRAGDRK